MDAKPGATPAVWATLPRGFPDGFCFDAAGRLYAAGSLGDLVVVFEPDGEVRDIIEMGAGSEPTNCCLGDGALYVTLAGTGQLLALDMPVEPLPLTPPGAESSALRPEQHALEGEEVRARVLEHGQQALAVARHEARVEFRRQPALVVGEQRALHPLDHLVARRQAVAVDLEADVLLGVAEALEEQRVLFGREDGAPGTRRSE